MATPPKHAAPRPLTIRRDGVRLHVEVLVVSERGERTRIDPEQYVVTYKRVADAVDMQERLERWHRVGQPHSGRTWPSFAALHQHADDELEAARAHQRRRRSGAFYRIAAALILVAVTCAPSVTRAQSDETLLLRSCVSERGWRTDVDDCLIVAEVTRERMERRGETFSEALRALAPRLHGGTIARRRWLLDLDVDCHRPEGWPRTASWERRRTDCEETVREVRAILGGSVISTCTERPRHWGSHADVRRRELAGYRWRDAVCPGLVLLNRAGFLYRRTGGR